MRGNNDGIDVENVVIYFKLKAPRFDFAVLYLKIAIINNESLFEGFAVDGNRRTDGSRRNNKSIILKGLQLV